VVFHELLPDTTLADRLGALPEFGIGRKKQFSNWLVAETADVRLSVFDYRYTTGHGKSKRVRRETIAAVETAELRLPTFQLRPEGTFDRIGSMIGMQDIDFDDHPGFSKTFVLKSNDEQSIRGFLDRPLLDYFAERSDISFETSPGLFVYFRKYKQVDHRVHAMRDFLSEGFQTLQALQERFERA